MGANRISQERVPALDGLRGFALIAILLYHSDRFHGGFPSVDMFFALSGFLITSLLLAEWRRDGRISVRRFWGRRARRLLPALAVFLVGVSVYAVAFADRTDLGAIRSKAISTVLYVANWHAIVVQESYFDQFGTPSPLRHAWTLAVEEQFYLLWPLLVLGIITLFRRRTPQAVLVTAIVLGTASSIAMAVLFTPGDANRSYYGTDTRAYALFAGIAVAAGIEIWGYADTRRGRRLTGGGGILAAVVILALWAVGDAQASMMYHGGFAIHAVALMALLVAAGHSQPGIVARFLALRVFVLLGMISYGVYLWHWPINLVLDPERTGIDGWALFTLRTVVALAFGTASYLLVERPILRGAGTQRQWRIAVPAVALIVFASVIAATAAARPAPRIAGIDATDALTPNTRRAMSERATLVDSVVPPDVPRVLVVGDSVSLTLAAGSVPRASGPIAIVSAAMVGCGVAGGIPLGLPRFSPESVCGQWPKIWQRAIDVFEPDALVLLVGPWDVQNHRIDGEVLRSPSPELRRHLLGRLALAQSIARDAGIPLILLTTPCFTPAAEGPQAQFVSLRNPRRISWFNDILGRAAANDPATTRVVSFGEFVCPNGTDRRTLDGVALRDDGIHFTRAGAAELWDWLTPRLVDAMEQLEASTPTGQSVSAG